MTENANPGPHASLSAPPGVEMPETDDPVVLRELLRQAREHLRLRESIERLMAENVARTEALLLEARASQAPPQADAAGMRAALDAVRASLADALASIDRLGTLLESPGTPASPAAGASNASEDGAPSPPAVSSAPRTVEVLLHEVHSPALARSLQQHLRGLDGVDRAEVRELAEGLLRITVESTGALDGDALATWEPQRRRTIRTARPDVLEIELAPGAA